MSQAAAPPDVAILDHDMPAMTGLVLVGLLRAERAFDGLPIVVPTS